MNQELRTKKLAEIKAEPSHIKMTGLPIKFRGEVIPFDAYKIPLDYLVYNQYNGRIGSDIISYENQFHTLNPENSADKRIIEDFLWYSKELRNKSTMEGIIKEHQKVFGIVTSDGVIIDGNRRAMLLNRIWRDHAKYEKDGYDVDHAKYFIAVILPEGTDKQDILQLETEYQMGEEARLDYNPIEKYLKVKQLREAGFDIPKIAIMMNEKEHIIEEWVDIMLLMDDYLVYLGYDGIYTRLDEREGQLKDLASYLRSYTKNRAHSMDWDVTKLDISDLRNISFDYIRAIYEGKDFRLIGKPSNGKSFFGQKDIWDAFRDRHYQEVDNISETSPQEMRSQNPDRDLSQLLKERDGAWSKQVLGPFKNNLKTSEVELLMKEQANEPMKLLEKAMKALESINPEAEAFYDPGVFSMLSEVNSLAYEYKKMIQRSKVVTHQD